MSMRDHGIHVGGSGDLVKWTEKGQVLEGIWKGITPGKFGDLGLIELPDGKVVRFPLHTVLADRFKRIRQGAECFIEYLGKEKSKQGTEYKAFTVIVGSQEDILPLEADEADEPPF